LSDVPKGFPEAFSVQPDKEHFSCQRALSTIKRFDKQVDCERLAGYDQGCLSASSPLPRGGYQGFGARRPVCYLTESYKI
jgi:hypothetical protein